MPEKWTRQDRPVCIHLAGTGDHVSNPRSAGPVTQLESWYTQHVEKSILNRCAVCFTLGDSFSLLFIVLTRSWIRIRPIRTYVSVQSEPTQVDIPPIRTYPG